MDAEHAESTESVSSVFSVAAVIQPPPLRQVRAGGAIGLVAANENPTRLWHECAKRS